MINAPITSIKILEAHSTHMPIDILAKTTLDAMTGRQMDTMRLVRQRNMATIVANHGGREDSQALTSCPACNNVGKWRLAKLVKQFMILTRVSNYQIDTLDKTNARKNTEILMLSRPFEIFKDRTNPTCLVKALVSHKHVDKPRWILPGNPTQQRKTSKSNHGTRANEFMHKDDIIVVKNRIDIGAQVIVVLLGCEGSASGTAIDFDDGIVEPFIQGV